MPTKYPKGLTSSSFRKMIQTYNLGVLKKKFNVSRQTLYNWMKKLGITRYKDIVGRAGRIGSVCKSCGKRFGEH